MEVEAFPTEDVVVVVLVRSVESVVIETGLMGLEV